MCPDVIDDSVSRAECVQTLSMTVHVSRAECVQTLSMTVCPGQSVPRRYRWQCVPGRVCPDVIDDSVSRAECVLTLSMTVCPGQSVPRRYRWQCVPGRVCPDVIDDSVSRAECAQTLSMAVCPGQSVCGDVDLLSNCVDAPCHSLTSLGMVVCKDYVQSYPYHRLLCVW